jgi:uncharacterized protein with ATP-grasp and redox domains
MKITPPCIDGHIGRAQSMTKYLSEEKRAQVDREVKALLDSVVMDKDNVADVAYKRNEIIRTIAGDQAKDIMRVEKEQSLAATLEIMPELEQRLAGIQDDKERFSQALRMALAGNTLEFGTIEHNMSIDRDEIRNFVHENISQAPTIDDTSLIYDRVKEAKRILYFTDNTAELALDKLFIEELSKYATVVVAPLSRETQDDATINEVIQLGIHNIPCVKIAIKGRGIGVLWDKITHACQKEFEQCDLIIAKGMACYETLGDPDNIPLEKIKNKVVFMLKAKYQPLVDDFNAKFTPTPKIQHGDNVVHYVR